MARLKLEKRSGDGSEAMGMAFQDISKKAGQAAEEDDDDVIHGRASTLQLGLVGIKKEGPSSPTVPLQARAQYRAPLSVS